MTGNLEADGASGAAPRRWPLLAAAALGVGLVLAPVVFQMFTRAPLGGEMIDEFEPFMTEEELNGFEAHLDTIDAAHAELATSDVITSEHTSTTRFVEEWPEIQDTMGGMLSDIQANVDNYQAVAALPPFPLFPWFFVIPGLLTAGLAGAGLRRLRTGPATGHARVLVALGVGLVAAPAVFQMFTRAPLGGQMIDDFKPIMTEELVAEMQRSFLTIGNAEGELRNRVLPQVEDPAEELPATSAFVREWPTIGNDMAPMIGAMSDNLDNFAAVAALPPFPLFPWFFVIPGVLLAGFAGAAGLREPEGAAPAVAPIDTTPEARS